MMRKTLRRSCDTCSKSKLRCDLRTPRCSRCSKKAITCIYANEPLSSLLTEVTVTSSSEPPLHSKSPDVKAFPDMSYLNPGIQSFDPFDSYPRTRLPRVKVQQLIQHFLSTIAFQYYPLDLNAASNPFIVSWWPLALADPALFHVSLQTASLDVELRDRKGFTNSDILMADSVSLIRMKVDDPVRASQDETLDSVVTLAAIEYGKGNVAASKIHIDGVISIVRMRGGISAVKLTNPLTARMVSWVSMIISDTPVFSAQDDFSADDGIPPSPQWYELPQDIHPALCIDELDLDPAIRDIVLRLRNIFHSAPLDLPTTDLHDLTCFVLHKLLPSHDSSPVSSTSECVRSAIALYMLIIHGPTYFTHARLQRTITLQLQAELQGAFTALLFAHPSLVVWLLSIGLVASEDTRESPWFTEQARTAATTLGLFSWNQILHHLTEVLWLTSSHAEAIIRLRWELVSQSKI